MASIVAAHMAQQNEGNVGHPVTEPASTMTSKACHQNVVTSHILTPRQNGYGKPLDEPHSPFCAAGNTPREVRACSIQYCSEARQYQHTNEPPAPTNTKPQF